MPWRWILRHAERHEVDHLAQARVAVVELGADQAQSASIAPSHRSRCVSLAHMKLCPVRSDGVQAVDGRGRELAAGERGTPGLQLECLERLGAVQVDHDARRGAPQPAIDQRPLRVGHDRVGVRDQRAQRAGRVRPEGDRAHAAPRSRSSVPPWATVTDAPALSVARELPAADAQAGHLLADRVGADEQHARATRRAGGAAPVRRRAVHTPPGVERANRGS